MSLLDNNHYIEVQKVGVHLGEKVVNEKEYLSAMADTLLKLESSSKQDVRFLLPVSSTLPTLELG